MLKPFSRAVVAVSVWVASLVAQPQIIGSVTMDAAQASTTFHFRGGSPGYPNGVTEWCVNATAVDPFTNSVLLNSEDGTFYRWNLVTNPLTEAVVENPSAAPIRIPRRLIFQQTPVTPRPLLPEAPIVPATCVP